MNHNCWRERGRGWISSQSQNSVHESHVLTRKESGSRKSNRCPPLTGQGWGLYNICRCVLKRDTLMVSLSFKIKKTGKKTLSHEEWNPLTEDDQGVVIHLYTFMVSLSFKIKKTEKNTLFHEEWNPLTEDEQGIIIHLYIYFYGFTFIQDENKRTKNSYLKCIVSAYGGRC